MPDTVYLGFDTSNYTTSVAAVDSEYRVLANKKYLLPVAEGERGLRQSDALFAHTKQLPLALQELREVIAGRRIGAIGVSDRPRNQEGSYMPCFLSGVSAATAASVSSGAPLSFFSHQCGHLAAALLSCGRLELAERPFAAYHLSGGTTELLLVSPREGRFFCEIVGGTEDISAGQLIDRIGVMLGLRFPAGREMERLALSYAGRVFRKRPAVRGSFVNLSGAENVARHLYAETKDPAAVAAFVFGHVADALVAMTDACREEHGALPLLCAGGVMSAACLRELMQTRYGALVAEPALSSDNAVGVAALALRVHGEVGI